MSSKRDHMLLNTSKSSFIMRDHIPAASFYCGLIQRVRDLDHNNRLQKSLPLEITDALLVFKLCKLL